MKFFYKKSLTLLLLLSITSHACLKTMDLLPQTPKGSIAVVPSEYLTVLIKGLDALADQDFPEKEVNDYLSATRFDLELLNPYMFFSEKRYTRNLLYHCPRYEILLLCWSPDQVSPIHGHEGEKCWMRMEVGNLHFTNYDKEIKQESHYDLTAGNVDGPAFIHKVTNSSKEPAMSLHLYAKPFKECDVFNAETGEASRCGMRYYSINGKLTDWAHDERALSTK